MKSIAFPNIFNRTVTNLVEDYDATLQNIKSLILSGKNELFGDPYYGTNLKKLLFSPNDVVLKDVLIDDLYTSIREFIPQLSLTRNDITIESDRAKVYINIKAINQLNFQTNMYNIVLFDTVA